MKRSHLIAGAATVALLAGGAGAIAATSDDKAAEKTVLTDAAKTLGSGRRMVAITFQP